ncbi:MAG TPA: DUF4019 domain-containing protein [Pyrinomonadaceae bacterium]
MKVKGKRKKEKGKTESKHPDLTKSFVFTFAFFLFTFTLSSCALRANREGIPSELQSTLNTLSEDIDNNRYEKIYNEAAAEWRRDSTLDESSAVFKTLKSKLGRVENRALHTATEERNSGGPLPGHSFIITYQTKFEHGDGMETFTLIERDGRWLLARYFVNSTALK